MLLTGGSVVAVLVIVVAFVVIKAFTGTASAGSTPRRPAQASSLVPHQRPASTLKTWARAQRLPTTRSPSSRSPAPR